MSNMSITKELIIEAQNGNSRAMNQLIKLCIPNIKYSIRKTIDYHTQEDLIQEICIRIIKKINHFKYESEKFLNWVSVLTRNFVMNFFNEKKTKKNKINASIYFYEHEKIFDLLMNVTDEDSIVSQKITMKQIEETIDCLPTQQKEVFVLYYFEGMKHREIAEAKGISESTSKTNLRDAKKTMRNRLTKLLSNS